MQVLLVHVIRLTYLLFLAIVFFGIFVVSVYAASVEVTPSAGTYSNGQSFTVTIQVNPAGQSINAVESQLTFDNTKLAVVSVAKTGSAFSLWTTEPTFSNSAGTIDFGGGSPTPFSSRSTLVSITFRALDEGTATVGVSSASALAADGLGTDVYSSSVDGTYTIGGAAPTPVETPTETPTETPVDNNEPTDATITFGEPPRAPEAGSATFLDPELWYATKDGIFIWEVPFDVDAIALDISTSSEYDPETIYDPPIEELITNEEILTDGIQYLTLQYKNQVDWGAILHRKIKIDTIAPEPFTIDVHAGNSSSAFPLLTFEANDTTSGIEYYEMAIAGGEPIEITPDEARLGYLLTNLEDGTYTIRVKAFDFAGNETESSVAVLITAGWMPPLDIVDETSFWDLFKGKNLVIITLLLIIIIQTTFFFLYRRRVDEKEQKLRKETREIQDQMEKVFSALRDEIYDQINSITKRKRLSKREREVVEELNQALEVSETLVEKEIGDVGKILK